MSGSEAPFGRMAVLFEPAPGAVLPGGVAGLTGGCCRTRGPPPSADWPAAASVPEADAEDRWSV
ncbi:hypothetical protein GCM10010430_32620 [Kitasatospora cystarginea]|uniref:Uncharacterized protein n=1 Tax=Kitasatospora cystarginea TaxID=58350 RepID=A0ABN3E3I8_9ACTN